MKIVMEFGIFFRFAIHKISTNQNTTKFRQQSLCTYTGDMSRPIYRSLSS